MLVKFMQKVQSGLKFLVPWLSRLLILWHRYVSVHPFKWILQKIDKYGSIKYVKVSQDLFHVSHTEWTNIPLSSNRQLNHDVKHIKTWMWSLWFNTLHSTQMENKDLWKLDLCLNFKWAIQLTHHQVITWLLTHELNCGVTAQIKFHCFDNLHVIHIISAI